MEQCDRGTGAPVVDTVLGVLETLGTLDAINAKNDVATAAGILGVLIWGASASTGFRWAGECEDAQLKWNGSADEQPEVKKPTNPDEEERDDDARALRRQERRELEQLRREHDAVKITDPFDAGMDAGVDAGTPAPPRGATDDEEPPRK